MKKNYWLFPFIIVFLFSVISLAQSNILLGFWNFGFPASSGTWGYIFLDDGRFIYYDASQEEGYFGTIGKWKVEKNRVYLLPDKDLMSKEDNFYALKSTYVDWQLVSDLRSINNYWYPSEKDSPEYPSSISIKVFKDREITHYVQNYFKFYGMEGVKKNDPKLIKIFEQTAIKKQ